MSQPMAQSSNMAAGSSTHEVKDLREIDTGTNKGGHADTSANRHLVFNFLKRPRPLPGKRMMWLMLFALFTVMFLAGWNDASQGPLLPSLQEYYSVNYLIISIIWLANFVGFLSAGITNVIITDRFGFGIAAPFGALMQGLGYVFMCWGSPYPLFVCAYLAIGFGLGLQDAQVNSLTSRLPNASPKMFMLHAVYGLGATVSPLVSTAFVQKVPEHVYTYFAVSLGLAILTFILLILVFRGRTEDQVVGVRLPDDFQEKPTGTAPTPPEGTEEGKSRRESETPGATGGADLPVSIGGQEIAPQMALEVHRDSGSGGKMKRIMKTPAVHYMAFYIMIYVGIEVAIGGWATSYIIDYRGGDSDAGYVTTGYFGGITLGRVILIPVTDWMGKRWSIYVYTSIAIALDLVVWFVPSIPGNAVCFALIGVVLGPMYPIVMMVVTEVMPGELQAGTIGWIASLGQAGSALLPFITGAIAEKHGVWVLQPLMLAFMGVSLVLWFLVPRDRKQV